MKEVSHIYNSLFRYESKMKQGNYPIHKKLRFDDGRNLLDFITDKVQFKNGDYVLDAGCGTGHTLFYLNEKYRIKGTGISISEVEIAFARQENIRLKSTGNLQFQLKDFNETLPGLYDKIFCIESLKHSNVIKATIQNLLNSLDENGTLIIVDDFLLEESAGTEIHRQLWQAPGFSQLQQLKDIIQDCGHTNVDTYGLTRYVPARSLFQLSLANSMVNVALFFTSNEMNRNIKTYKGALLLERLYKKKQAGYWLLIIKRE